ncbi:MAG: transglutaminase domain-containing protein [Pirellulales bacterium]|nr:transglutaminase domain-containing protein [Pirellulales bacterium]
MTFHHIRLFELRNIGLVGLILLIEAGCADRSTPQLAIRGSAESSTTSQYHPATSDASPPLVDPTAINAKGQPKETWEAVFAYGTKIGWGHVTTTNFLQHDRKLVRIENENHVAVDREGQRTTIDIATQSIETPTGELLRFATNMKAGPSQTLTTGQVDGGLLRLETTTQGKTVQETIPWLPGTLGFSAAEQSLANAPMQPATKRTLQAIMPVTNEIVQIELSAGGWESTALVDHAEDLLRIENTLTLPAGKPDGQPAVIRSRMWTNREGQVLKTAIAALHQETFRTSREFALSAGSSRRLDLVVDNTVPVTRTLANPHSTHRIQYRVRLETDDPARVFFSGRLQQVVPLDLHTAEITVLRSDRPAARSSTASSAGDATKPAAGAPGVSPVDLAKSRRPPTDDDRLPNNLIQSDDSRVVAMAQSVAADETNAWNLALKLEKFVKQTIKLKNFTQAFSTAAEVAQLREGDCTEHAVLLAALARARGIPARVAIGLVYQSGGQSFAYHMWNELWLDDRWVPLDASLGQGGIGAAHLKLTDSNLAGAGAYSSFLPVAQVIGQLKIEILVVE